LAVCLWHSSRSNLKLSAFYRDTVPVGADCNPQHIAALLLFALLVANPVVVFIQVREQVNGVGTPGQGGTASAWRTLQGLFFVFNALYVVFSVGYDPASEEPRSYRTNIWLATVLSAAVQIIALVLVVTEHTKQDPNPYFDSIVLGFQTAWTAWSVVYDYIITLGLFRACAPYCVRVHESVVVPARGQMERDETLL